MKYTLIPWEIPLALPSGFLSGSGYNSLYIVPLVIIQIQYSAFSLTKKIWSQLNTVEASWSQFKPVRASWSQLEPAEASWIQLKPFEAI